MQSVDSIGSMTQAMAGVDFGDPDADDALLVGLPSEDSRQQIRIARNYQTVIRDPAGQDLVGQRAKNAATISMHGLANRRAASSIETSFTGWPAVTSLCAHAAKKWKRPRPPGLPSRPALEAKQAQREAQLEAASADLERKADELQRAAEEMKKTDAEKQSFKDEADAMEAELGF